MSEGVAFRTDGRDVPTVTVDDAPSSTLWQRLIGTDAVRRQLVDAVRDLLAGTHYTEREQVLRDAGATALDGGIATVFQALDLHPAHERHEQALTVVESAGHPEPTWLGHIPLAVARDVVTVLESADAELRVDLQVSGEWFDRRADQRRDALAFLAPLLELPGVAVVASGYTCRLLLERHRDDLPARVRDACSASLSSGSPMSDAVADECVSRALDRLDPDETQVRILRTLDERPDETAPYTVLYGEYPGHDDATIRGHLRTLAELGLVDTYGPDHDRRAELTPAGARVVDETTQQVTLPECVRDPPKSSPDNRGARASTRGGEDGTAGSAGAAQPPEPGDATAEAVAAKQDGSASRAEGAASIAWLNRHREAVYRRLAPEGGIALHNYAVDERDDPREPSWGYDEDEDHLVIAAEYRNPYQYAASVARALTSPRTWERVLTKERVDGADGSLSGLAVSNPAKIRDLCNVGWLDSRTVDGRDDLKDALLDAREEYLEATTREANGEFDGDRGEFRGETLRDALGLIGSMRMLCSLAGVEVTFAVEAPWFEPGNVDDGDRAELAKHVGKLASIGSQFGGQPIERQVFEERPGKIERALEPEADPVTGLGQQLGRIVVVGPAVESAAPDVWERVQRPSEPRADPRPVAAAVPVQTEVPRETYAAVVGAVLADKGGLRPSRKAVDVLRGFVPSPFAAAAALRWLSPEAAGRGLRLDEVRYALATAVSEGAVPETAVLPEVKPSERAVVATLLQADEPLAQAELVDRAGISAQSFRNHREHLSALGVVVETGEGWRLALPFGVVEAEQAERGAEEIVDVAVPGYVADEQAPARDALYDAVLATAADPVAVSEPSHPVGEVFHGVECDLRGLRGPLPWLRGWVRVVEALAGREAAPPEQVYCGVRDPQKRLPEYGSGESSVTTG